MTPSFSEIPAFAVTPGKAAGPLVRCTAPLSFWGGFDSSSGQIIAKDHPQLGTSLIGKVLLIARTKGSSSSASVLAEAIRKGTAPKALIMRQPDLIMGLGAVVAAELYGLEMPIVAVSERNWRRLMNIDGSVTVESSDATTRRARVCV